MSGWIRWGVALALVAAAVADTVLGFQNSNGTEDVSAGPAYNDVLTERGNFRIAVNANGVWL